MDDSETSTSSSTIAAAAKDLALITASPDSRRQSNTLTNQVSQRDCHQHDSSPPPGPLSAHPFSLNFPTLNDDGSVDDLIAHQSRRYHSPTPPAALSSLGAKAKMLRVDNGSESDSSFADYQYDMIDDLSEISNDDHDTASLASNNGDDAQLTSDDAPSEDDMDEPALLPEPSQLTLPLNEGIQPTESFVNLFSAQSSPSASFHMLGDARAAQVKAENDLLDSYMSEDLETPRQSSMPAPRACTKTARPVHTTSVESTTTFSSSTPNHILFTSERSFPRADMDMICSRIASCLKTIIDGTESTHKVVRLPATHSDMSPSSATIVCGEENISATVRQVIGAELKSADSYHLRILDPNGEHSSFFAYETHDEIDQLKPDIAILYLDRNAAGNSWFSIAYKAICTLKVPVLVIYDPAVGIKAIQKFDRGKLAQTGEMSVSTKDLEGLSSSELTSLLEKLVRGNTTGATPGSRKGRLWSKKLSQMTWFKFLLASLTAFVMLPLLLVKPASNPAIELSARRADLASALTTVANSSDFTKNFDIDHLLPGLPNSSISANYFGHLFGKSDCDSRVHFQGAPPNHIVISVLSKPHFPQVTSTQVYKADDRMLLFNLTKLIDGVYDITVDPLEAFGTVKVSMLTRNCDMNITASHDFGNRMLQRKTYEKAGTEVSKAVSKDVAVMRRAAKSLTEKLSTEIGAGVWATKNVTSQLALYMARDLQIIGYRTVSMLGKAADAGNRTASQLTKDVIIVQKDLAKYTRDFSAMVTSKIREAKMNTKALAQSNLQISRQRLHDLAAAVKRKADAFGTGSQPLERKAKKVSPLPENANRVASSSSTHSKEKDTKEHGTAQHGHTTAMKPLDASSGRIKRQQSKADGKMARAELKRLEREAKQHQKALKRRWAEMRHGEAQ